MEPKEKRHLLLAVAVTLGVALMVSRACSSRPTLAPPVAQRPAVNYNPDRVCPNAFEKTEDHSNSEATHFKLVLQERCFSGWVLIPNWWPDWQFQLDTPDDWIAFLYSGWGPHGPYLWNQANVFNHFQPPGRSFRLQGRGTITVYTNVKHK